MKYRIEILPVAEGELVSAAKWYDQQRHGLGARFLLAVEARFESFRRTPMLFNIVYKNVRRARLRGFPYGIFFEVHEDRVVVLAVYHARRNPDQILKRFKSS